LNLFIPENPYKKMHRKSSSSAEDLIKHQAAALGETTDLAWWATVDELYFTWYREVLNLLI
jgi:hypothetical protein